MIYFKYTSRFTYEVLLGLISFESLADSLRLSQTISVVWNSSSSMLTDSLQLVLMLTLALKICSFALALAYIFWIGPGGCEFGPADCGVVQANFIMVAHEIFVSSLVPLFSVRVEKTFLAPTGAQGVTISVRLSVTSLSRAVNFHLSRSESTQRAIRAIREHS